MRAKYLWLGIGALGMMGAIWFARATWRAHLHLVTLNVRQVPLREVVRRIERQAGTRIPVDDRLDTRVTLNVQAAPLETVLERLAEQAGARYVTCYAVYDSTRTLTALENAWRHGTELGTAGWTNLTPAGFAGLPLGDRAGPSNQFAPLADGGLPAGLGPIAANDGSVRILTNTGRGFFGGGGSGGSAVVRVARGGKGVDVTTWSPVELVMETGLSGRLGDAPIPSPDREAAVETARKVRGRWTTYYVLRKSEFGGGMAVAGRKVVRKLSGGPDAGLSASKDGLRLPADFVPDAASMEQAMQQRRYDELGRLTPQQRVQRARDRLQFQTK